MSIIQDHEITSIIRFILFIFSRVAAILILLKDRMTYIIIFFIDFPCTVTLHLYHSHAPERVDTIQFQDGMEKTY